MAGEQISIDESTVFDDVDGHQIEFSGVVDGEEYNFAVQYSLLEALSGEVSSEDAVAKFHEFIDVIKDASLSALSRDMDPPVIVVTEEDLEQ